MQLQHNNQLLEMISARRGAFGLQLQSEGANASKTFEDLKSTRSSVNGLFEVEGKLGGDVYHIQEEVSSPQENLKAIQELESEDGPLSFEDGSRDVEDGAMTEVRKELASAEQRNVNLQQRLVKSKHK